MSSYSLTEALKTSRYRKQQLQQQQTSPHVVFMPKSRSDQTRLIQPEQIPPPPHRRNEKIVCVPSRPRHSPSISPPSLSLEETLGRGLKQNQHNSFRQQQQHGGHEDNGRSFGTAICVSDTISQDSNVSSNSTRQQEWRRRQRSSKRYRGGDNISRSGRHQAASGSLQGLLGIGQRSRYEKVPQFAQPFGSKFANQYRLGDHLAGFSANSNCSADQQLTPGQQRERSSTEFGCEDLKVRQWHDSLSNEDSGTMTEDRTRSAGLGTDMSALTLSRTELSSERIVGPRRVSANTGTESPSEGNDVESHGQMMQLASYQRTQISGLPLSHQHMVSSEYQLHHQFHLHQLQPHQKQQLLTYPSAAPPASKAPTLTHQPTNPVSQLTIVRHSGGPPLSNRSLRAVGSRNHVSQHSSHSNLFLNQSELRSRESKSAKEILPALDELVHQSVVSCSKADTNTQADTEEAETEEADTEEADTEEADSEEADTEQADTEQADTEQADTILRADSGRQAVAVAPAEDTQQRLATLRPRLVISQQASVPAPQPVAPVLGGAAPAPIYAGRDLESRRSSRYGRLKTPEICKRSFLSILRHNIAASHVSNRARINQAPAQLL